MLIVSFADIRRCLEQTFMELCQQAQISQANEREVGVTGGDSDAYGSQAGGQRSTGQRGSQPGGHGRGTAYYDSGSGQAGGYQAGIGGGTMDGGAAGNSNYANYGQGGRSAAGSAPALGQAGGMANPGGVNNPKSGTYRGSTGAGGSNYGQQSGSVSYQRGGNQYAQQAAAGQNAQQLQNPYSGMTYRN